ncbi:N-glycosylase/DNA lyase [Thermodesulfobacterium hydrogeniphilum]|uniref:N-glycosylase/DNA lyase n=1 Tax=Thermodesulfobacterium hydrogeniphilum TaxID=161156 RepID=UPI000571E4B0|nr:N-glycosylase/DNA lyase [Thermodesulfobacterium hydrogeniphilum]
MEEKEMLGELFKIYKSIKPQIILRLKEFKNLWLNGKEEDIFKELIFCLLTPQSKAEKCWECVKNLEMKNLLFSENEEKIAEELKNVRFRFNKAKYIIEAKKKFVIKDELKIKSCIENFENPIKARDYLVTNIKGLGYKEASHFLRNIGLGENLAILDRHILKNLKLLKIIQEIPKTLSRKWYIEIENRMKRFAKFINIPLSHLDFVLWYKETGKIFK